MGAVLGRFVATNKQNIYNLNNGDEAISAGKKYRFKLLHVPHLARCELLRSLDLKDIITLSMCSTKMYKLVKSVNIKIPKLYYEMEINELKLFASDICGRTEFILKINYTKNIGILIGTSLSEGIDFPVLNIGGMNVKCRWKNYTIELFGCSNYSIEFAISNHVNNIFKCTSVIGLELPAELINQNMHSNIQNVTCTAFESECLSLRQIENALQHYPNLNCVTIVLKKWILIGETVSLWSLNGDRIRIFGIDHIYIIHTDLTFALFIFNRFTGRSLFLRKVYMPSDTIIQFIGNWVSGRMYTNLEIVHIKQYSLFRFDVEKIRRPFIADFKEWDGARRPQFFEYYSRDARYVKTTPHILDCCSYLDIERKTDGVVGSMFADGNLLIFCVWNPNPSTNSVRSRMY